MVFVVFAPANFHRVPVVVYRGPPALRAFVEEMFFALPVLAGDPPQPHGAHLAKYVAALHRVQHYFTAGWTLQHQQRGRFVPLGRKYRHHDGSSNLQLLCFSKFFRK